jgi:hypothetical protein
MNRKNGCKNLAGNVKAFIFAAVKTECGFSSVGRTQPCPRKRIGINLGKESLKLM